MRTDAGVMTSIRLNAPVVQVAQWEFADAMFTIPSDEFGDVTKLRKAGYKKHVGFSGEMLQSCQILHHPGPCLAVLHLESPACGSCMVTAYSTSDCTILVMLNVHLGRYCTAKNCSTRTSSPCILAADCIAAGCIAALAVAELLFVVQH